MREVHLGGPLSGGLDDTFSREHDAGTGEILKNRYRVIQTIGEGGMGEVLKAVDLAQERLVAIKRVKRVLLTQEQAHERLKNEATAMATLESPMIVRLFDSDVDDDGRLFLVMEFLKGESLQEHLSRGPLPAGEVIRLLDEVLAALEEAHAVGLVHRDLKPSNIFLQAAPGQNTPYIRLLDFGIAKFIHQPPPGALQTQEGSIVGTPAYMAPEQFEGKTSFSADLYALGATAFHALTGRVPFEASSLLGYHSAKVRHPPSLPASDDWPKPLGLLVERLMRPQADARPASATEARAALGTARRALSSKLLREAPPPSPIRWVVPSALILAASAFAAVNLERGVRSPVPEGDEPPRTARGTEDAGPLSASNVLHGAPPPSPPPPRDPPRPVGSPLARVELQRCDGAPATVSETTALERKVRAALRRCVQKHRIGGSWVGELSVHVTSRGQSISHFVDPKASGERQRAERLERCLDGGVKAIPTDVAATDFWVLKCALLSRGTP